MTGLWVALLPGQLLAQSTTAPALENNDPEFRLKPIFVGPISLELGTLGQITYDDNIYARKSNKASDGIADITPYLQARYATGAVKFGLSGQAIVRRYFNHTQQNAEGGRIAADMSWEPSTAQTLRLGASWERSIEDRGDPEARTDTAMGPRLINTLVGRASFRHAPGRILFSVEGQAAKHNAIAQIDDNRDYSAYYGAATLGYRASGTMFVTGTAFINRRTFRLSKTATGDDRDSTTYGGRLGLDFAPGGLIEGNISAGVFRHNPDGSATKSRNGFSLSGSLTYRPARRTALVLDLSNGDVATYLSGASGRTDTTARLSVQQEIRHNLFANAGIGYRRSKYVGTGASEDTVTGQGALEYLFTRNISAVASASYGSRNSDFASEEFDRFRGTIGLRIRF